MKVSVQKENDPCHGCRFSLEREDMYLFDRPYVCTNESRISELVERTQTILDLGRLKEANVILGEACSRKDSFERYGWMEPEDTEMTPHCYEKKTEVSP